MDDSQSPNLRVPLTKRLTMLSIVWLSCLASSAFSDASLEQSQLSFVQRYQAQLELLEQARAKFWQPVESSQAKVWVIYTEDLLIKRVIDFQREQVRISYQGKKLEQSTPASFQSDTEKFLRLKFAKVYRADDLLPVVLEGTPEFNQPLLNLTKPELKGIYSTASFKRDEGLLGDIVTITIDLPKGNLKRRAQSFLPLVEELAQDADISPALVMAIIHQETAFNVLASTEDAKFGLMLIAPAEVDEVEAKAFYSPEQHIESGIEQLVKLEQQLSGIEDPQARQLCVLAAYRVGVDEVAKVFIGRASLPKALPLINQLSVRQVRGQLRSQLQLNDSGQYVQQVSSLLALYDEF